MLHGAAGERALGTVAALHRAMTGGAPSIDATRAMRAASPALVLLGRAGYAAKGVVFVVIGALAAGVAAGTGGRTTDSRGALHVIGDGPMGTIALIAIGVGLLGYMAWRLIAAATDADPMGPCSRHRGAVVPVMFWESWPFGTSPICCPSRS